MKLHSLQLRNFRQHKATDIAFTDGITGIIGRNGAGKSTLLEAIAWALYGQKAVQRMERGKTETIRSRGARAGDVPEVTLDFELAGQCFRVVRRLNDASLFCGNQKLHTGTENVTRAVGQLVRMDPQAFFTSFFTGQKDLAFLKDVSAKSREAYIGKLLGYERLTKARDLANRDKLDRGSEIQGLMTGLGDPETLKQRKLEHSQRLKIAREGLAEGERALAEARSAVEAIAPGLKQSLESQSLHDSLTQDVALLESHAHIRRDAVRERKEELDKIAAAEAEASTLVPLVEEYEQLKLRNTELQELKAADSNRAVLQTAIGQTTGQINDALRTEKALETAFAQARPLREREAAAAEECAAHKAAQARTQDEWVSARSTLAASLKAAQVRQKALGEHLAQMVKAGPDGVCPTCERPLKDEFEKVTGQMRGEFAEVTDEIRSLQAEEARLQAPPKELAQLAESVRASEKSLEEIRASITKAEGAGEQLVKEQSRLSELRAQLAENETRVSSLPTGFDAAEHERVIERGRELKPVRDRLTTLRAQAARREGVERELAAHSSALDEILKDAAAKGQQLAALAFDAAAHAELESRQKEADGQVRAAGERAATLRADVQTQEALLKAAEEEEAQQKARLKILDQKKSEQRHLEALVKALEELRAALGAQIKPRLEEAASEFLAQVAPERYSQMDLDDDFGPRLYEEGEYKPVVSGGEEDILHLCLRLGVSQMIAERAGMNLCLLILDEVFGSLDEQRRENVISLLLELKGRFPQILLITHIESIHDMVDRCIWVDYDPETQSSTVREGGDVPALEEVLEPV